MTRHRNRCRIPLPQGWQQAAKSTMLHVISLAQHALAHARSWAVNSQVARVRLKAENDQLRPHAALLTEELRIKDARMMRIPAQKRPHYLPIDRMSILEVRTAHGWSMQPTSRAIRAFVGRVISDSNVTAKHLVCDKGSIFWCEAFKRWCMSQVIRPRYGAVGKHGSIAVVERFIRTLKDEATRRILISQRRTGFRAELDSFFAWYSWHRPHTTLQGKTPNEVYFHLRPANQRPRIEPRERWPRPSPCATPRTLIAGQSGARFEIEVGFHSGRRHLPIESLRRAA